MANIDNEPSTLTDLDYAIQLVMTGKQDPEFAARVQAETEKITEEIRRNHGVVNIAVDLIREALRVVTIIDLVPITIIDGSRGLHTAEVPVASSLWS